MNMLSSQAMAIWDEKGALQWRKMYLHTSVDYQTIQCFAHVCLGDCDDGLVPLPRHQGTPGPFSFLWPGLMLNLGHTDRTGMPRM